MEPKEEDRGESSGDEIDRMTVAQFSRFRSDSYGRCEEPLEGQANAVWKREMLLDSIRKRKQMEPKVSSSTSGKFKSCEERNAQTSCDFEGENVQTSYDFEGVNSIENFTVIVNGSRIDSDLPRHIWAKYYQLCCSQRSLLHARLRRTITRQLAAEIVSETVSIANAITDSGLSPSEEDYANWRRTLESFEIVGMNTGFLRARVDKLASLAFESEGAAKARRYREAVEERDSIVQTALDLELELWEMKGLGTRLKAEMEAFAANAKRYELAFEKEANAPW